MPPNKPLLLMSRAAALRTTPRLAAERQTLGGPCRMTARGATERAGMDADAILSDPFGVLKWMDTIERSYRRP
ncbi:hypothetical protein WME79_11910 [Sorangium sp. So ce726]|uniref:hypothetical protein n=1 Tax=Sorangium sp. So ce726 TaxID=3133319 RepID=UPI003F63A7AA